MIQGRCSNLPEFCVKAESGELIDMPNSSTECPACGKRVLPASNKPKGPPIPTWVKVGIACVMVVAGLGAAARFSGLLDSAPPAPPPPAAAMLRISGSAEMGETLVPALAKEFLASRKATDITQTFSRDARGNMIVTVSGQIDGKRRAIAIQLTGDQAGLADLDAGRCR
jgi:hypothetical protein